MSIDRFFNRNRFALVLVALHSLLIGAYAWIELDHAWNDMNPTMIVMAGLHLVDYALHRLLNLVVDPQHIGTYLAALLVVGGLFWFTIGTVLARSFSAERSHHLAFWR